MGVVLRTGVPIAPRLLVLPAGIPTELGDANAKTAG